MLIQNASKTNSMNKLLRMFSLFFRALWIASVACFYASKYLALRGLQALHLIDRDITPIPDAITGETNPQARRDTLRGRVLAEFLQTLGATFVKFGQILSTRPDLFGVEVTGALEHLQDRVRPLPFAQLQPVLAAEISESTRLRIEVIDEMPLASASVAQVHRGRLDTGQVVAIKIQRPGVERLVERDLTLMRTGGWLADLLPPLKMMSLPGAVERFAEAMENQLDFGLEAKNNERFAENFKDTEGVRVPELFLDLCSKRILTMEFIDGVRATEVERVGGDRSAVARRGLAAILQMVFRDGFVHADLHPGNIVLTEEGDVVLIDLGLVAEIEPGYLRPWTETFVALTGRDGALAAKLFYEHAPSVGDVDYAAFEADVQARFDALEGKPLNELEASKVLVGMMNVLRKHKVQVAPVFTVVNLAMLVAEGLGKQLDPTIDLIEFATPYLVDAMATAPQPIEPERRRPE